mgnify:FL=1
MTMSFLNMYCLDIFDDDYDKIKSLNYTPVGLGSDKFRDRWLRDNTGKNISHKNSFYGEYTFHYWFWKNKIDTIDDNVWIGFCAYRRFWAQKLYVEKFLNKEDFLHTIPTEWKENNVVLGQEIFMDRWTMMKIIKHGLKSFLANPKFFIKKNRNLQMHFDSFHGYGNLNKAIELLDSKEKSDFKDFMNNRNSFNRGNMFICKSKKLLKDYYESIFPWLLRCEKVFGFQNENYGTKRIYAFLAERYLAYWFNKYSNVTIWPVIFHNRNQNKIN